MKNELNSKPIDIKAKSVPLFPYFLPKGLYRQIDVDEFSVDNLIDGNENEDETKRKAEEEAARLKAEEQAKLDAEKDKPNGGVDNNDDSKNIIDFTSDKFSLNENGELTNSKGEVVKTQEQLKTEGYFDEEGNLINPDTKEILLSNAQTSDEPIPLIQEIQQVLGYELKDEDGKTLELPDTVEGIVKLVEKVSDIKNKQAQKEFLDSNPEIRAYANHLSAGGSRDTYFKNSKDYKSIDLNTLDADQKAILIYEDYIKSGLTEARAKALVEAHKKNNEIDAYSEESLNTLKAKQIQQEEQDIKKAAELRRQQVEAANKTVELISTTVTAGKIGEIVIPESDRKSFIDYLTKPVDKNGNTQYNLDSSKEDINRELQAAFWKFKGYDFNTMIKNKVAQAKVQDLRQRVQKETKKIENNRDVRGTDKGFDSISVDNIQ